MACEKRAVEYTHRIAAWGVSDEVFIEGESRSRRTLLRDALTIDAI
jgi:hypothetical protein